MQNFIGKKSIVRTNNAGVHYGTVDSIEGQNVVLTNARRIWYWDGAFTLSAVATDGINNNSKLSVSVPEILLTDALEVIPCSARAAQCLDGMVAHHG